MAPDSPAHLAPPVSMPAERELVFERFYRVLGSDPEGENLNGSGLGLAIVRDRLSASRPGADQRARAHVRQPVYRHFSAAGLRAAAWLAT